jgi:SsrA-binding protein
MTTFAVNKRAHYDYEIAETFEAGIALLGYEVKSIKTKRVSLKGAFVTIKSSGGRTPEVYLTNAHIPKYEKASTIDVYDPDRPRKLLLHAKEIGKLIGKKQEQGLTLVPLRIYVKRNLVKLEFGIGRGKKNYDKREDIKKRDTALEMRRAMKERR